MLHGEVTGEIGLELLEGRARHVLAAFQHAQDGVVDLFFQIVVLPDVAVERHLDCDFGHGFTSPNVGRCLFVRLKPDTTCTCLVRLKPDTTGSGYKPDTTCNG